VHAHKPRAPPPRRVVVYRGRSPGEESPVRTSSMAPMLQVRRKTTRRSLRCSRSWRPSRGCRAPVTSGSLASEAVGADDGDDRVGRRAAANRLRRASPLDDPAKYVGSPSRAPNRLLRRVRHACARGWLVRLRRGTAADSRRASPRHGSGFSRCLRRHGNGIGT
jgi:hypothetical protein